MRLQSHTGNVTEQRIVEGTETNNAGVGVGWGCRVHREPSMPPIHKANAPRGYAPMPVFFHGGINALLFYNPRQFSTNSPQDLACLGFGRGTRSQTRSRICNLGEAQGGAHGLVLVEQDQDQDQDCS